MLVEKYTGKSYKYLAIANKSFKKHIETYARKPGWKLTIDELYDILTPGSQDEIPADMVPKNLSDESHVKILASASMHFVRVVQILQTEYWDQLSEFISESVKISTYELLARVLQEGGRRNYMLYRYLVELYVQITILRTVGDHTSSDIIY
jgi:hypothetical protein